MGRTDGDEPDLDPTFVNTRREAKLIFAAWIVALLWVVPYCALRGYGVEAGAIDTVWGIPSWVFYGIAVPWATASAFALWFSLRVMTDDDLGEADA